MIIEARSTEEALLAVQEKVNEGLIFDRLEQEQDRVIAVLIDPQTPEGLRRVAEISDEVQRVAAVEAAADQVEVDRQGAYEALIGLGLTPGQASVTTGYYP